MANGVFWSFTCTAFSKLLVLISGILCAHFMSKTQYGEFGMVRSTINMFVVFGTAGLGITATKFISEYRFSDKERIFSIYCLTNGFAFITGLITTILVLIFSDYLATTTLQAPHLVNSVRIGAFLLFVTVLNGAQNGVLLGFEDYKARALNGLYGSIAESFFMIVGAIYYGVFGAVLGYGIGFFVLFVFNVISINKNLKLNGIISKRFNINKDDIPILYKFSLPAALASIMAGPTYWIMKTILVRTCGYEELAVFEAADYWKTIALFVPATIAQIALPILSSMVNSDKSKYWKVFNLNLGLNTVLALMFAIAISLCSSLIMSSYGQDYSTNTLPLIVLSFSTVFSIMSSVIGLAITSRAKMWIGFLFNGVWGVLLIGFSYLFTVVFPWGAAGISFAILLSYLIHSIYQFIYLKIIIK